MIPIELIKTGETEVHTRIYNLITRSGKKKICLKNGTWLFTVLYTKKETRHCSDYRAIALLYLVYKVFSKIISKRLVLYMEDTVGNFQAGFRRNKSTTDQIFAMKQILGKCYEYDLDIHCIFINFKQAFDSIKRNELYKSLYNPGIPRKLINLIKESLTNTKDKVVI
jgi:hypothetical protein